MAAAPAAVVVVVVGVATDELGRVLDVFELGMELVLVLAPATKPGHVVLPMTVRVEG